MKYFNVSGFLEEAVAKVPLDVDAIQIPGNLRVIRVVDYMTTGIDEDFTHTGSNAGKGEKAKSRENKRGNFSSHIDVCNSCVNNILTKTGMNAFSGITYSDIIVPRIPREFEGTDEDVDTEWNFIETCPSVMKNMKGEMQLSEDARSTMFVDKNKVTENTKLYKASLLFGYMNNENEIAAIDNRNTFQVAIKPRFLNLDPEMKYIDEDIEKQRPAAIALLAEIYSANPDDFQDASTNNQGTIKNDIKDLLTAFKSKVPEDGNIFLSADEIKEFLPLFEYFRVPKENREKNDKFFDKIALGVSALEKEGIHFGEYLDKASEIQNTIIKGFYDIELGYSQEGDKTHTETFGNKGEEIFVGYITGYEGQKGDEVIPVYITTSVQSEINDLKNMIGTKKHIGDIKKKATVPYKKVNTDNMAKRTGGNEIIFQLPREIYAEMFKSTEVIEEPKEQVKPVADKKKAPAKKKSATKQSEPTTPSEQPTQVVAPTQEPEVAPPAETPKAPSTSPTMKIFNEYGKQFADNKLSRAKAIALIKETIKNETGKSVSSDSIANKLDEKYGNVKKPVERSPSEIEREQQYDFLFGADNKDTKLAKSSIPRIKELVKLGHNFTPAEIDNLVARGLNRDELDKAIGLVPVMEARVSPSSFSLKALLENINKNKLNKG